MDGQNSRALRLLCCTLIAACCSRTVTLAQSPTLDVTEAKWNGFQQLKFQVEGRSAYLVVPDSPISGKPWIWRARFPSYHAEMDLTLVRRGFHIGYVDVAGLFGSPRAIAIGDLFYKTVRKEFRLAERPALEGVSRGGLFAYNWAARHPELVACIYCDTPVCDFKSWPGGSGQGLGAPAAWKQCLAAYDFDEQQAREFRGNPIDHASIIARAKIPLLHIVSENDRVVPPAENSYLLRQRLRAAGHDMSIISVAEGTAKSNGHHFDHPEPGRVVKFIHEAAVAAIAKSRDVR